jgi:hypothetical protein
VKYLLAKLILIYITHKLMGGSSSKIVYKENARKEFLDAEGKVDW